MSDPFYKPHDRIRIYKANDAETRDRGIRIYKSSPEDWTMQFFAPMGIGFAGLRDGKDYMIASANCSLDDLRAIRDAIDAKILETEADSDVDECPADRLAKVADELCDNECTMAHVEEIREIAASLRRAEPRARAGRGPTITGRGICSGLGPCKFHESGGGTGEPCATVERAKR